MRKKRRKKMFDGQTVDPNNEADIRIQVGDVILLHMYVPVGLRYDTWGERLGSERPRRELWGSEWKNCVVWDLHCQSIMQAELNWLFMRRIGTFIDAGCHQPFT